MSRIFLLAALFAATILRAQTAPQGQLDGNLTLFTVLAAMNAAGYDADLGSPANHPLRAVIRKEIASKNLPVVAELKRFFDAHRRPPSADLSQYISYALSVKGPPDFEYRFRIVDLPPDIVPLDGLSALLVRFYGDASIEELWKKSQPAFDEAIARYHEAVTQAVFEVNTYLRNATSGYLGRRFQIYLDLLGAPNQVHTRSYLDDYFVVLTPSPELKVDDIRHAYLHYLLDPPSIKYSDLVMKKKGLGDYAQAAPALDAAYKNDFLLLTTECLIKAIESRLARGNRQALIDQALREGFVLTPAFAELLPVYEKQDQSMRLYFPELIKAIDLKREELRLEHVEFAAEAKVRKAKTVPQPSMPELTGAQKSMEEAETLYEKRDLEKAKEAYTRILQETGEKPLHARSYYGLARIAVLQKDPELAERLFQKSLESSPEPYVRAWVLVYLGRLSDAAGERETALQRYKEALVVEGASRAARAAAEKGIAVK